MYIESPFIPKSFIILLTVVLSLIEYDFDTGHSTDDDSITPSGSSTLRNSSVDARNQMRVTASSSAPSTASKNVSSVASSKIPANVVPQLMHRSLFPPPSSPSLPNSSSVLSSTSSSVQTDKMHMKDSNSTISTSNFIVNPTSSSGVSTGVASSVGGGSNALNMLSDMESLKSSANNATTTAPPTVYQDEPRMLIIETKKKTLGLSFVGGNVTGIFVHRVVPDSLGESAGIRVGDQILEFNGVDLRVATAEQAYLEIAKPTDKVSVVVQHNMQSECRERWNYGLTCGINHLNLLQNSIKSILMRRVSIRCTSKRRSSGRAN